MKFKITDVSEHTEDWENNYGQYRTYLVRFEGDDEQVQINRKKQGDGSVKYVPQVGEELEGSIQITDKGKKFKQDYSGSSLGNNYGGKPSKKDGPSEEYWAGKQEIISTQWAMGKSLELLIANREEGQKITVEQVSNVSKEFKKHLPELPSA